MADDDRSPCACDVLKERLLAENKKDDGDDKAPSLSTLSSSSSSSSSSKREVKIKISRKELEELLAGVGGNLSVDQALARLVGGDDRGDFMLRQRSWRPALQSIPEVN